MGSSRKMLLLILFPGFVFSFCNQSLSIYMSDGVVVNNSGTTKYDSLFEKQHDYKGNENMFHCICELKNCVRKCCGQGEAMIQQKCSPSLNKEIDIYKFYNVKDVVTSTKTNEMVVFYNTTCPNSNYFKVILDGKFYLQTNASVYGLDLASEDQQKYKMYSPEEYCLDHVLSNEENGKATFDLKVFLCVQEAKEEVQVDQKNSVGNLFYLLRNEFCLFLSEKCNAIRYRVQHSTM